MKNFCKTALAVGTLCALTFAAVTPTLARDTFAFSFDTGDVAFAYTDGYWDHSHNWHGWRNSHERRQYSAQYRDHYKASRHSHERNGGWRDSDHDGVPDRHDDAPGNPNRH